MNEGKRALIIFFVCIFLCSLVINFILVSMLSNDQKRRESIVTKPVQQPGLKPSSKEAPPMEADRIPLTNTQHPLHKFARGIDISHYQLKIDWPSVKKDGKSFVYIKATGFKYKNGGPLENDPTFSMHWADADQAGFICGAYHFFHPNSDPVEQANFFIKRVKSRLDDQSLPPMLDIEYDPKAFKQEISKAEYAEKALKCLNTIESALQQTPVIYTNLSTGNNYLSGEEFRRFPLFIAYPEPSINPNRLRIPKAWNKQYAIWQYTSKLSIAGIQGTVDEDLFNGSLQDLKDFIKNSHHNN